MSDFSDAQAAGLAEAIAADGGTFQWNGRTIAGIVNQLTHTVTTLKSYFPGKTYPKCGESIIVGGTKFQITKRGNAKLVAGRGGMVEDQPFTDDASDPSLDLVYDKFAKH